MWEAIVVLAKTPAAIALVVGLFGLLFYMVKKGILSFKGHGVSLGTADSEAKIRNMQQLYAKALEEACSC